MTQLSRRRIPYAQVPGRVVILHDRDIDKYCRDHNMTWGMFWECAASLEASVQAKRTARGAERDTQPLLLAERTGQTHSFYSIPLNLPSYTASHVWILVAEPKVKR